MLNEQKEEENKFGMLKAKDQEISNLNKEIISLKKEFSMGSKHKKDCSKSAQGKIYFYHYLHLGSLEICNRVYTHFIPCL